MRWDDLNMGDKSRMIKLAVDSGITDLRTIRDVYNSYAEGGHLYDPRGDSDENQKLIDRINSTSNANFVQRLKDPNRKSIRFRNTNDVATHRMSWSNDGDRAIVYPEVQEIDGELVDMGRPPYTKFAALDNAIEQKDTLMMSPPQAQWFTENYKDYYPNFAFGGRAKRRRKTLIQELPEVVVTPKYLSYWDAAPEQTKSLTNKSGKYNTTSMGDKGYTHFDTISARYKGLNAAMQRAGFSGEEIGRLSPFLLTQLALEGGWVVDRPDNNFGGMMSNGKRIEFDTEDSFYDTYLKNLDARWGDEYLGKGKGWRNAKTINEYADTINREDLGLHTKEAFEEYNRKHKDHPAYIYTPLWENNNTGLMDENKFGGIYDRALGNYELLMKRMEEWDKFARNNKIIAK